MNARKLLDWRKLLIYTHRWMGIAFGLLFVSWFISGIVFMYWGMPGLSEQERLDHQHPVDLSTATWTPREAAEARDLRLSSLRLEMRNGRPVYRIGQTPIYADTGQTVFHRVNANIAMDIVRGWAPDHADTVRLDARLEDSDQWTLQSAQRRQMPLYRIALDDPAGTYYYVAENTGEIVMKTDRESRFKGFWSGVLHWVYFTPLRRNTYAWNQFIIWGSFAGGFMCLLGLAIGVWRFSPSARFRRKRQASHSAYSGLMRWHHYSGLLFGLVTFTWIISGAFSVNPFGMFSGGRGLTGEQRQVLTGGPVDLSGLTLEELRAGVAALNGRFAPKEIDIRQFRGELYMTADRPPSRSDPSPAEYRMVWIARPHEGAFTKFDDSTMEDIARETMADVPVRDEAWLHDYDNYYRSRDNARPLPVLRVRYLDDQRTWLYLDPHRGTVSQLDRSGRWNRWLYAALHEFDFPFLYERRPLWDITVILLSIGGIVLGGSTVWPTVKRLARRTRHYTKIATRWAR